MPPGWKCSLVEAAAQAALGGAPRPRPGEVAPSLSGPWLEQLRRREAWRRRLEQREAREGELSAAPVLTGSDACRMGKGGVRGSLGWSNIGL